MASLLPIDTIRRLTNALVPAGLATSDARNGLLQGIHPGFVASLPKAGSDLDQVRSDLVTMNQVPALDDGQVPLQVWLDNAVSWLELRGRVEAKTFRSALDELAGVPSGSPKGSSRSLTGPEKRKLQVALLDAFSPSSLKEMVSYELDEDLDQIARQGTQKEVVYDLIEWAGRTGRERELIETAQRANPGNELLKSTAADLLNKLATVPPGP